MRNMWKEFKEFINKGDIVMIAVALVMALYFKQIVDQIIAGVITPIIAAIFGESNYESIGFDIGDARISIGLVISALITFLVVLAILFVALKAWNALKRRSPEDDIETELSVLKQIRDGLNRPN